VNGAPVSVVIPARNAGVYLAEAIDSVLDQGQPVGEIVVVDDGSTDDTAAIAGAYGPPVRVLHGPAGGPGAARNRGVEASTGELVAFLDADDLWPVGSLAARLAVLGDPEIEAVFGHVEQFVCERLSDAARGEVHVVTDPLPGLVAGTMLARRTLLARVGRFPTDLRTGEFIAWYLRAQRMGLRALMTPDIVLRRRVHKANHGRGAGSARADYVRIVRENLALRREADGRG
jgi:glycosyltransferase involved in cell wall biosynthesis